MFKDTGNNDYIMRENIAFILLAVLLSGPLMSSNNGNVDMAGVILFCFALAGYLIPYIIARSRKHYNATAIGALNLLLGWTLIGWIVALVWSLTANVDKPMHRAGE